MKKSQQPSSIFGEILSILEEALPDVGRVSQSDENLPRKIAAKSSQEESPTADLPKPQPFEANTRLWAGLGLTAVAAAVIFFGSRHQEQTEEADAKAPSGFRTWLVQAAQLVAAAGIRSLFAQAFSKLESSSRHEARPQTLLDEREAAVQATPKSTRNKRAHEENKTAKEEMESFAENAPARLA